MTAICCAKCQRPMPNWIGAISFESTSCPTLCRKCFGKSLIDRSDRVQVSVELNYHLLKLVDTKDDKLRSIACLALQFSIQKADPQGIFFDPTSLLKKALKTLYSGSEYTYNLLQPVRMLLIRRELWLLEGRQVTGKGGKSNKMKLGVKIHPFQAPL